MKFGVVKKFFAVALAAAMVLPMAGCGCGKSGGAKADTGKVLNIYCWNEEWKGRVATYYPDYEEVDDTTGKIGDYTVKWNITPNKDNAYQNNLDAALEKQEKAATDDKIDIFLVEADYASKYLDTDYALKLSDIGIEDSDLSDQYEYTQTIAKDSDGNLKASAWQACSAGLVYNRAIAKEVFGTDDPDQIQALFSDWDKYKEAAAKVAAAGYTMCSVNDTYRTYSNNVSAPWVQDGKIVIDDNIMKWIDDSKALVDSGAEDTDVLWEDDWAKGKYPEGKTFCFFGPAWLFSFSLAQDESDSIAGQGGWGFCQGPQSYYWGGTWIVPCAGTDNSDLVKDIIIKMTADKDILKKMAIGESECVNSKTVLEDLATSDDGNVATLGGQNPYALLAAGAEKIDLSNIGPYDQGCNEEIQNAMKDYFAGKADKDTCLNNFYTAVIEKYPNLSK